MPNAIPFNECVGCVRVRIPQFKEYLDAFKMVREIEFKISVHCVVNNILNVLRGIRFRFFFSVRASQFYIYISNIVHSYRRKRYVARRLCVRRTARMLFLQERTPIAYKYLLYQYIR